MEKNVEEKFYLNFLTIWESPYLPLDSHMTIGSEEGDYILKDQGLSAKHCSFFLRNGVVTLVDHGSSQGTFLNEKKLVPGKEFILMVDDEILLGEKLKILLTTMVEESGSRHLSHWDRIEENLELELDWAESKNLRASENLDREGRELNPPSPEREISLPVEKKKLKLEKKNISKEGFVNAGATSRLFSLLGDMLIAYGLASLWGELSFLPWLREYFFSGVKLLDPVSGGIEFLIWLLLYCLVSSLLFKVTLGQYLMGLYLDDGSAFKGRVLGFLRTLIGWVFLPFLVFDIPALFSKRTFKEVLTGTRLLHSKGGGFILRGALVIFLLGLLSFFSPFFQGFWYSPSANLKLPSSSMASLVGDTYQSLLLGGGWAGQEIEIPLGNGVQIYSESFGSRGGVEISSHQKLSLVDILKMFYKEDIFWRSRFPVLRDYYKRGFTKRGPRSSTEEKAFRSELLKLVRASFSLGIFNTIEHIKNYGFFIKPYIALRESFYKVFGEADPSLINIKILGDSPFVIFSQRGVREMDMAIPLYPREDLKVLTIKPIGFTQADYTFPKLYNFLLSSRWGGGKSGKKEGALYILDLKKRLSKGLLKWSKWHGEKVYEFYLELGGNLLFFSDENSQKAFEKSIFEWVDLLETDLVMMMPEGPNELLNLKDALKELHHHYKKKNHSFFGVEK